MDRILTQEIQHVDSWRPHLARASLRYASKKYWSQISRDLREIYTAPSEAAAITRFAEFEETWGQQYPAIIRLWRSAWEQFTPFLAFPPEVRRVIYTTNAIESLNARFRQATRREDFPNEQAALKVLYLVIRTPQKNRTNVTGGTPGWKAALNSLTMYYGDRINLSRAITAPPTKNQTVPSPRDAGEASDRRAPAGERTRWTARGGRAGALGSCGRIAGAFPPSARGCSRGPLAGACGIRVEVGTIAHPGDDQRRTGEVRETTSGGVAMRVVAVTGGDGGTALSRFLARVGTFDGVLEAGERVRPELGEQGPHRAQRLRRPASGRPSPRLVPRVRQNPQVRGWPRAPEVADGIFSGPNRQSLHHWVICRVKPFGGPLCEGERGEDAGT